MDLLEPLPKKISLMDFLRQKETKPNGGGVYNTARVAIHELGHSAILWFHEAAGAFEEVTVVPTAQYDGLTTSTWKVQKTRAEMRASIATDLGGRCAEEYFFGESIGHVSDESEWKKMAMKLAKAQTRDHPPAHRTKARLVRRQQELIAEAHAQATAVIVQNAVALERMALFLFKRKTIGRAEFEKLIGFPLVAYGLGRWLQLAFSTDALDDGTITLLAADAHRHYVCFANKTLVAVIRNRTIERRLFVDGGPPKLLLSLTDSLVVVDSANSIHLFDVRSGQPLVRLDSTASFDITAIVHPITYLNKILVGAADGRMRLWNLCSGRLVHEFPVCDAAQVAGSNALVMHEQAATAFMENDFKKAEQILMEALRLLVVHAVVVVVDDGDPNVGGQQSVEQLMAAEVSDFWEPLYNNLGHVLRKLGRYTDAIHVHRKSLLLSVAKADAWACLGVCYASLAGTKFPANANAEAAKLAAQATEALNRALALKPGDDLVKTALDRVMQFEGELLDTVFEVHENVDDKNYALSRDICMDEERLRGRQAHNE